MRLKTPSRKILIVAASLLVVLILAVIVLVAVGNRIIKGQVEKALGEHVRIERLSLGFNKVVAENVTYIVADKTLFQAKKVSISAGILTLLGKAAISSLDIEEPVVRLDFDEKGNLLSFPPRKPSGGGATKSVTPRAIHIKQASIKKGTILIRDPRLPSPGSIDVSNLDLRFDNLSLPIENSRSKIKLKAQATGNVLSASLSCDGSFNPFTGEGEVKIEIGTMRALTGREGPAMSAENITCTVSSRGNQAGSRLVAVRDLTIKRPFLRVEEDKGGHIVTPVPGLGKEAGSKKKQGEFRFALTNIKIQGGEVLYLDGKIAQPPYPIRITDIEITVDRVDVPFDNKWSTYQMTSRIPGKTSTGQLHSAGKTNFRTKDTGAAVGLTRLDITTLGPYIEKKGEAKAVRGTLDMDMKVSIQNEVINAPTHAVIRDLELAGGKGVKDQFLGVPRSMLLKVMEAGNHELPIDFVVEGRLDNPQFSLRENMTKRIAVGIAQKLGVGILQSGEGAVTTGGKVLKGIEKGLKDIFK